jgi:hypothetical protein
MMKTNGLMMGKTTRGRGRASNGQAKKSMRVSRMRCRMRQIQRELLDHPLQDNEYQSAIISGLAVLMMKGDKGWHDAEDFTSKYSAVIKLAQLMVV